MLSRFDQDDLVLPLFESVFEGSPWEDFLQGLMARTKAQRICLEIGPAIASGSVALQRRVVAHGVKAEFDEQSESAALARLVGRGLRPGRVYVLEELRLPGESAAAGSLGRLLAQVRIGDARMIEIAGAQDRYVRIALLHEREFFEAKDSALLSSLVPAIRVAMNGLAAIDAIRLRMVAAEGSLARLGIGQAVLDHRGELVVSDELWQESDITATEDAAQFAQSHAAAERETPAVVASAKGERPILLRSIEPDGRGSFDQAAVVASFRTPQAPLPQSVERIIAASFGLSPRESVLAARLASGQSLSEAGQSMGLTRETARNYSKSIYAKADATGQVDLVRKILTSLAVLG